MTSVRRKPSVVFDPQATDRLGRGIETIARAVLPTLGPSPRGVAFDREDRKTPDVLDDGGSIVQRILAIEDCTEDVGAMLLRHTLWSVHRHVGDGTATACAIFLAAIQESRRQIAAGVDPVLLRDVLLDGSRMVLDALDDQAIAAGDEGLQAFIRSVCQWDDIADQVARAFLLYGQHVRIEIRDDAVESSHAMDIPGSYWRTTLHAERLLTHAPAFRSDLTQVAILATDLHIDDPAALRAVVQTATATGAEGLLVIANRITDACVTALLASRSDGGLPSIAVRTPFASPGDQMIWLDDIEMLTGARAIRQAAGMNLSNVDVGCFGYARRAWCDLQYVGIVSGRSNSHMVATRVHRLKAAWDDEADPQRARSISDRIATLTGSSVRISVRPGTRDAAERIVRVTRAAIRDGLVQGGGLAFLHARGCIHAIPGHDRIVLAARRVLEASLEAPFLRMAENRGVEPGLALSRFADSPVAVMDSAGTAKIAWATAIQGAAQAMTISTIVHHAAPEEAVLP